MTDQLEADLSTNDLINVRDSDNVWYDAKILEVLASSYKIRFLGWSKTWDMKVAKGSKDISKLGENVTPWREYLKPGDLVEYYFGKADWRVLIVLKGSKGDPLDGMVHLLAAPRPFPAKSNSFSFGGEIIKVDPWDWKIAEMFTHNLNPRKDMSKKLLKINRRLRFKINNQKFEKGQNILKILADDNFGPQTRNYDMIVATSPGLKNDGKTTFYLHKCIISASSKYFDRMLNGSFKEAQQGTFKLSVPCDIFIEILNFMYLGRPHFDPDNITAIISYADEYEVLGLLKECEAFLSEYINTENILEFLKLAQKHKFSTLSRLCREFICENMHNLKLNLEEHQDSPELLTLVIHTILESSKPRDGETKQSRSGYSSSEVEDSE